MSCQDDINDQRFRNENYVYYEEDGKPGKWLLIKNNSNQKPPKSRTTFFFPNGNKYLELSVLDSFPNRIYKFYDKENRLTRIKTYKSDSVFKETYNNGYFQGYYSNLGNLHSEGLIKNNLKQGKWNYYYEDGLSTKERAEYKNGKLNGVHEEFWRNGNSKSLSNWKNGLEFGEGRIYHENGNIYENHFIKNGKIHGRIEQYYPNGAKRFWANSWLGIVKDTSKYFYETGILQNLKLVTIDTITRISKGNEFTYYPSRRLKTNSEIKNDLLHGISITYYENGNKKEWIEFKNNRLNGKYIQYYESGEKKQVLKGKDKYLLDDVYFYDKNGIVNKTLIVEKGIIVDSIVK